MPFGFELTTCEVNLLETLQSIVRNDMAKKYNKIFDEFIEKVNKFTNRKLARVEKESYQISAELFEHAVSDKRKVRLMFKNRDILDCIPVKMEKFIATFNEQVVVFELKGALALRYNLRENERLVKPYDGTSITVSNQSDSKDVLLSRLLRYDDKCEIIHPKSYREEMAQIIDGALSNYGEIK